MLGWVNGSGLGSSRGARTKRTRPRAVLALLASAALLGAVSACSSGETPRPIALPLPPSDSGPAFLFASTKPASQPSTPAPAACSLLTEADVLAVAGTFKQTTITIDGHKEHSEPPTEDCGFNQKGVYKHEDMTITSAGDSWAKVTVVAGGAAFEYEPGSYEVIAGLGDGAYFDPNSGTVVVLAGNDVLQILDQVPVNQDVYPDLKAAYRQAAQALAQKVVAHL
jgi:hypothetical protein